MIGRTLGLYLATQFLRYTLGVFCLFLFLIIAVDVIEFSRRVGNIPNVDFAEVAFVVFLRAPAFAEGVLPFAVLFGAAAALIMLNRRLELVVARASGLSVWQFLLPLVIAAALVGLSMTLAYNPVALAGKVVAKAAEARIFSRGSNSDTPGSDGFWMRLSQKSGDAVVRAEVEQDAGADLTNVTVFRFDTTGQMIERLDARSARFEETEQGGNHFVLTDVTATAPGRAGTLKDATLLPVKITLSELQSNSTNVDDLSVWSLFEQAERAAQSGKNALQFVTRIQSLFAAPLLFVAMVLVAATVSLRFARFGVNAKGILAGVLGGFMVYVASKLLVTFGSNGLVPPFFAAWSPALVASLIGITVLLHQEDG